MTKRLAFAFITSDENRMQDTNGLTRVFQSAAVYNLRGCLIKESLRTNGVQGDLIVGQNPSKLTLKKRIKIIIQAIYHKKIYLNAYYCGPHFSQFGHFLTESLSRIPISEKYTNQILFHSYDGDKEYQKLSQYQVDLLNLLRVKSCEIIKRPAIAINLFVQKETVILNQSINNQVAIVWNKIIKNLGIEPSEYKTKIFLSRSKLNVKHKRVNREKEILYEAKFRDDGFDIINPEEFSITDQIKIINSASIIAGFSGSALHLCVFADSGATVIELGDNRNPKVANYHQVNICAAKKIKHIFIPYTDISIVIDMIAVRKLTNSKTTEI